MPVRRLCVDIDNVVAQTDVVMRDVICEYTKGKVKYRRADIVEFDYHRCKDQSHKSISRTQWKEIHSLFSKPSNLWRIKPFQGVQACLERLLPRFSIHFATSRLPEARRTTVEWLQEHGFPAHDLHFISHGEKHVALGDFAAAVEDHYQQAADFADLGIAAYLMRAPWNKNKPKCDHLQWVNDWDQLTDRLMRLPE